MKNLGRILTMGLAAGLLAACGGGNGGDSMPPTPQPGPTEAVAPEASESAAGLVKYLTALSVADADAKEPVDLSTFAPKTPDDTEPEPVG